MSLYTLLQQRAADNRPVRVGLIGAGKFGAMFLSQARLTAGIRVVGVADLALDRARAALTRTGWPCGSMAVASSSDQINDASAAGRVGLTEDALQLIGAEVDVIVECTGIVEAGVKHALAAIEAGRHLIMVNVEADALVGPWLWERAERAGVVYSMAYGDQPALVCEMVDWARTCGFEVVAAGKGTKYLPEYHYSTPDTVWDFYGFTPDQVSQGDFNAKMFNSFLDGSKSAIEMAAIANATGLVPQREGLGFPPVGRDRLAEVLKPADDAGVLSHSGTVEVVSSLNRDGSLVQDDLRWGVYITFRAPSDYVKRCFQEYALITDSSGSYAALYRPSHLIGLELGVSVASVALRREATGAPRQFIGDVASVAKRNLLVGDTVDGEGGYSVFGRLVPAKESLSRGLLPLGLASRAKVIKPVARDKYVTYADVELDSDSLAAKVRRSAEEA